MTNVPGLPTAIARYVDEQGRPSREFYEYLVKDRNKTSRSESTFYSIEDIEGAVLSAADDPIALRLETQGIAYLSRETSAPSHDAYIQSADGAYYVFTDGCLFPELCGVVGDDSTDNTDALIAWGEAMTALNPETSRFEKDAVYRLLNDANATTHHSAACIQVEDLSNCIIDFNGATLKTTFTNSKAPECIRFSSCTHFTILDFKGVQTQDQGAPADTYGTRWVQFLDGCRFFSFLRGSLTDGFSGVTVTRTAGSNDARCEHFHLEYETDDVYYACQYQWSGDHSSFHLRTLNAGRSFIGYNFTNVRGRIYSTPANVIVGDVLIGCNGHNLDKFITSDIELEYISHSNGQAGACPIVFNLGQTTENNAGMTNHALALQNVRIKLDIQQPTNSFALIVATGAYSFVAGTLQIGDAANYSMTNIRLSGTVNGNPSSQFMSLGESANGFTSNTTLEFALHDITALQNTRDLDLGQYAAALVSNVDMVGGNIARAGGYDERYLTIIHSRSADEGSGFWYSKIDTLHPP